MSKRVTGWGGNRFSVAPKRQHASIAAQPDRNSVAAPSQVARPSAAIPSRIKPKAAYNASVQNIVEFLTDTYYDSPVSMKELQCPSQKLVFSIFRHILNHFIPLWTVPEDKAALEECFITTYKAFGYPVLLKRSTITNPGAPHSASQVLAALDWLRNELSTSATKTEVFSDNETNSAGKLGCDFVLKCIEMGTREPSDELEEELRGECEVQMGCRKEDLEALEAQLQEQENQPSADNLMAQERDLRARLATAEREIAEQSDRLTHILSSLPEAEAKATAASSRVGKIRAQIGEVASQVESLDSLLLLQRNQYGSIMNTYHHLVGHLREREHVRDDLARELSELNIELARMDHPIAPALDDYNSLVVRLTDPSLPKLEMHSYLYNIDPLKEIPMICDKLAVVHTKLKEALDSLQSEEARKQAHLRSIKADIEKKTTERSNMEQKVARLQRTSEELERNVTAKKEELEKWVTETSVAIAEARQAIESRQQYMKQLQTDVDKAQKEYETYRKLNRDTHAFYTNFRSEVTEFLKILIKHLELKAQRRRMEDARMERCVEEIEAKATQLEAEMEGLLAEARKLVTKTADATTAFSQSAASRENVNRK